MLFRKLGVAVTAASGAAAVATAQDVDSGHARLLRSLGYSALTVAEYKRVQRAEKAGRHDADSGAAAHAELHRRAAERLLHVCRLHGGMYTKLGQFAASMSGGSLLPTQYGLLSACEDKARAPVDISEVRQLIKEELGVGSEELFASLEPTPVATASLAQVHRGHLPSGEAVAVKVQYPKLRAQAASDLKALRVIAALVGRMFPTMGYEWLLPEFEASLESELDFHQEAHNAQRQRLFFAEWQDVHVPAVHPQLSSRRLLTMEWIDGVKVTDAEGLDALGIVPTEVAPILCRAISAMVFESGLVHCDPHAGNLLVRPLNPPPLRDSHGTAAGMRSGMGSAAGAGMKRARGGFGGVPGGFGGVRPQLVILDHGMVRELSPAFRREYCRLWRALLMRDHATGRRAAVALGLPEVDLELLSLLLMHRTPKSKAAVGSNMSAAERQAMRKRYNGFGAADVNLFLQRLPRDMLFVMRTWSMVRSLNKRLGGTTRQRFMLMSRHLARGSLITPSGAHAGAFVSWARSLGNGIRVRLLRLRFRLMMNMYDLAFGLYWRLNATRPASMRQLG